MQNETATITVPTRALVTMLRALDHEAADCRDEVAQQIAMGHHPGAAPYRHTAEACEAAAEIVREAIRATL